MQSYSTLGVPRSGQNTQIGHFGLLLGLQLASLMIAGA
jgi:hypothetical protein